MPSRQPTPVPVSFLTVAAHAVSHAGAASGHLLGFRLILGIKVGRRSVIFKHDDHDLLLDEGARPKPEAMLMPQLMAARLIPFAQTNLVPVGRGYDSMDFTLYVSGLKPSPMPSLTGHLPFLSLEVSRVKPMALYVISSEERGVVHSFIGLNDQRALSVYGLRGPFGIAPVRDLMRAYGATMLARAVGPMRS